MGGLARFTSKLLSDTTDAGHNAYYYAWHYQHTSKIIQAIKTNNHKALLTLLPNSSDIEACGFDKTLLHDVVSEGHIEMVEPLLQNGANLEALSEGMTPLARAINNRNIEMVRVLLQLGAKPMNGRWQTLPYLLELAVQEKNLTSNQAATFASDILNGNKSIDDLDVFKNYLEHCASLLKDYDQKRVQQEALDTKADEFLIKLDQQRANSPYQYLDDYISFIYTGIECSNIKKPVLKIRYYSKHDDEIKHYKNKKHGHADYSHYANAKKEEISKVKQDIAYITAQIKSELGFEVDVTVVSDSSVQDNAYAAILQVPNCEYYLKQVEDVYSTLPPARSDNPYIKMLEEKLTNISNEEVECLFQQDMNEGYLLPLHMAIETGELKMVKLILQADIDLTTICRSDSPLWFALNQEQFEIAELLIQHGADVSELQNEISPLMVAAENNQASLVKILIQRGAWLDYEFEGRNALSIAREFNHPEVLNVFLSREKNHKNSNRYGSASSRDSMFNWHRTIDEGDHDFSRMLVHLGVNPNRAGKFWGAPIFSAIDHRDVMMVDSLLAAGANVNVQRDGQTPFQVVWDQILPTPYSTSKNILAIFAKLIKADAHLSYQNSLSEIVNLCITHGLNDCAAQIINQVQDSEIAANRPSEELFPPTPLKMHYSRNSAPPLLKAIRCGNHRMVEWCLNERTVYETDDWCLKNDVKRPLIIAIETGDYNLMASLIEFQSDTCTLKRYNSDGDVTLQEKISPYAAAIRFKAGYYTNSREQARMIKDDMLRLLEHCGESPEDPIDGYYPAHLAILAKDTSLVYDYLNRQADINAVTSLGSTVLHFVFNTYQRDFELIHSIMQRKPNLLASNQRGEVLLDIIMTNTELRNWVAEYHPEGMEYHLETDRSYLEIFIAQPQVKQAILADPDLGESGLELLQKLAKVDMGCANGCLARLASYHDGFDDLLLQTFGQVFFDILSEQADELIEYQMQIEQQEPYCNLKLNRNLKLSLDQKDFESIEAILKRQPNLLASNNSGEILLDQIMTDTELRNWFEEYYPDIIETLLNTERSYLEIFIAQQDVKQAILDDANLGESGLETLQRFAKIDIECANGCLARLAIYHDGFKELLVNTFGQLFFDELSEQADKLIEYQVQIEQQETDYHFAQNIDLKDFELIDTSMKRQPNLLASNDSGEILLDQIMTDTELRNWFEEYYPEIIKTLLNTERSYLEIFIAQREVKQAILDHSDLDESVIEELQIFAKTDIKSANACLARLARHHYGFDELLLKTFGEQFLDELAEHADELIEHQEKLLDKLSKNAIEEQQVAVFYRFVNKSDHMQIEEQAEKQAKKIKFNV